MGIYTGNSKLKLYIGDSKVKKAYIGAARVYSSGNPVTYHVDSGITYTEEVEEGSSCLSPTTFTPAKSGWTFVGWRQDNAASSSTLSSLFMGDNPIALYAVFSRDVTITYYNGSAEALYTTKYKYYNNGNTANPAFTIPQASKSGWLERGWSVSALGNGSITYNSINNTAISSNITLYGMYQQTITVTYYNDSQSASHTTGTRYYNSNGNVTNPSFTIAQAAKNGWTVRGWSTGTNADAEISYGSISGTEFSSGVTLYGLYYQNIYLYTLVNGTTSSNSGCRYYNSSGNIVNPSFTVENPSKDGWTFQGWSSDGSTAITNPNISGLVLSENTTRYAVFKYTAGNGVSADVSDTLNTHWMSGSNHKTWTYDFPIENYVSATVRITGKDECSHAICYSIDTNGNKTTLIDIPWGECDPDYTVDVLGKSVEITLHSQWEDKEQNACTAYVTAVSKVTVG